MKAEVRTIKQFLGAADLTLKIPVYQRNYNWKKKHCQQLANDIIRMAQTGGQHFLGNLQDQDDNKEFDTLLLIDGQQRITSVLLALKAIYDLLDESDEEESHLRDKIRRQYLLNEFKQDDRLRLKPIEKDASTFARVMEFTSTPLCNDKTPNIDTESNIYLNYMFFISEFESANRSGIPYQDILEAIERMQISENRATAGDNAQQIFESLNSTGLDLSPHELIINYMLMPLSSEEQESIYRTYLKDMDEMLGDNISDFLEYYLTMKRKSNAAFGGKLNQSKLYESWKNQFSANTEYEQRRSEFEELKKYAKYYVKCLPVKEDYRTLDAEGRALYALFNASKQKSASIPVMFAYNLYDTGTIGHDELVSILEILVSYNIRSVICGYRGLYAQTASLLLRRINLTESDIPNEFEKALHYFEGNVAFPNDSLFYNAFATTPLYLTRDMCKYILYALEENQPHSKELPAYSDGQIEHIMPQTLSSEWENYLEEQGDDTTESSRFVHTLGNLTLSGFNQEMGNKAFDKKKEEYSQSNYNNTKTLAEYDKWNYATIQSRTDELARQCCNIWKLSKQYQKKQEILAGKEYDLYYEPQLFTSRKPAKLIFMGDEITVSSWKKLVAKTFEMLLEYDEDRFDEIAVNPDFPIIRKFGKSVPEEKNKWTLIGNGYWYASNKSALDLLNATREILYMFEDDLLSEVSFVIADNKK